MDQIWLTDLCHREKRRSRHHFDLLQKVHESEYSVAVKDEEGLEGKALLTSMSSLFQFLPNNHNAPETVSNTPKPV